MTVDQRKIGAGTCHPVPACSAIIRKRNGDDIAVATRKWGQVVAIFVNTRILAQMGAEMSRLCEARPAPPPSSAEACGSAAVARALAAFSNVRSETLASLAIELETISDAFAGTLADAHEGEEARSAVLRNLEPELPQVLGLAHLMEASRSEMRRQ